MQPPRGLRRWIAPHFAIVFFLIQLALGLRRAGEWLSDPGTGWHLATGRLILESGAVPRHDVFSFTAEGRAYVDYYWLFQLVAAWLVRLSGLPLYGAVCLVVYALVPALLFRRLLRSGANPLAAFAVMPAALVVLQSHAMARPHVLTYVFLVLVLNAIDDARLGRRGLRDLWWLPLLTALWCNIHGGFMAGIALVVVAAVTAGIRWLATRDAGDRRAALVLGALAGSMVAATLVNPYGPGLLLAVADHVRMTFSSHFLEFQSPPFNAADATVGAFELLILALFAVMALGPLRFAWIDVALALVTLHWALTAQRNMNVFVLVAAPMVARGLTPLLAAWLPALTRRWQAIGTEQATLRSSCLYVPVASAAVVVAALAGRIPFPTSLDGLLLSRGATAFIAAEPRRYARPFNDDPLGGPLIYRFWPAIHVFVDDRALLYGDDFVLRDYYTVLYGRPGWEAVLERWQITSAILTADAPCIGVFRASDAWRVAYEDPQNVVLVRPELAAR